MNSKKKNICKKKEGPGIIRALFYFFSIIFKYFFIFYLILNKCLLILYNKSNKNNTMKKQLNSLESILAVLGLELDDFFIVSFWKTSEEVHLQGHNTPELFSKLSKLENYGFNVKHFEDVNQWHFTNPKIKFHISLS